MTPLGEILVSAHRASIEELQQHKNERDREVQRLREEMAIIHTQMEPKWIAQQRNSMGPANLTQRVESKQLPSALRDEEK